MPALRQRTEDVPELARHFIRQASRRMNAAPCELDESALSLLHDYAWPGNVRELENIITRACVLNPGRTVAADTLRPWLSAASERHCEPVSASPCPPNASDAHRLDQMERQLIEATLNRYAGHRDKTAKALGIGVRTLANKLRQYGYGPRTKAFARAA